MSPNDADQARVERLTKHIRDLHQLVTLLLTGLSRAKPWQRQLAGHLGDADHQLQVLRLTVAIDRPEVELAEAAEHLAGACRLSSAMLAGTRIDPTKRTAVKLVCDLAERIRTALNERSG